MLEGTLASKRACQLAPAVATARRNRVDRSSSVSVRQSTTLPAGLSLGPSLCIEKPNEPRVAPCTNAAIPSSSATAETEEATASAFVVRRARVAPARRRSVVVAAPTPIISTRFREGLGRSAVLTTGSSVTSPVAPWASVATSISIRSVPRSSASSAAPGPRVGPSSPGSTATATTAAPASRDGGTSLSANWGGETCGGSGTHKTLVSRTRSCCLWSWSRCVQRKAEERSRGSATASDENAAMCAPGPRPLQHISGAGH